jgi:hypothetical protein
MKIGDVHNKWRDKWKQAMYRGAEFFVETDTRSSGRRVAIHEYPKRNVPYSEDMGRKAVKITVQGYLITGPGEDTYLIKKDLLIEQLEKDGPGMLRLPLPYQAQDVEVMVVGYTVTETRERGGYCTIDMEFVEYGDPTYRSNISTGGEIRKAAGTTEDVVVGPSTDMTAQEVAAYWQAYQAAQQQQEPAWNPTPEEATAAAGMGP